MSGTKYFRMKAVAIFTLVFALLITMYPSGGNIANAATWSVTVNAGVKYQTIEHFGASDAWSMDAIGSNWSTANKNQIADLLFSTEQGIGLSAWRFNIGGCGKYTDYLAQDYAWRKADCFKTSAGAPYDWSKQAGQQWFLQAAKDRGVDNFIAFVNSPPSWMTKNGKANPDSGSGSSNLAPAQYQDFSNYLRDVLLRFKDVEGINFNYISPVNEPTWDWNDSWQEGNRYNNTEYKNLINNLYDTLQSAGLSTKISATEAVEYTAALDDADFDSFMNPGSGGDVYTSGMNGVNPSQGKYKEYIKDFLGDATIRSKIDNHIDVHSYWSDYATGSDDRLGTLRDIFKSNVQRYSPSARVWMSEYSILGDGISNRINASGRDLGVAPGLQVAKVIHYDLTRADATAWHWWTAVSHENYKDGLIYTDYNIGDNPSSPNSTQNILQSKMLWALGNYSKFIRPGAERVQLSGLSNNAVDASLLGSAYVVPSTDKLVLVFVNTGSSSETVNLNLQNIPSNITVNSFVPYLTSSSGNLTAQSKVAPGMYNVPPQSIVTLVSDAAAPSDSSSSFDSNKYYRIISKKLEKVIDVGGQSTADGANVTLWDNNGGHNQQFRIEHLGSGVYRLTARHSGKVLEVAGQSTSNGANVQQWSYSGGNHQRWTITETTGGYYRITGVGSGKALEHDNGNNNNGSNVDIWDYWGGDNQQWQIVEVQ